MIAYRSPCINCPGFLLINSNGDIFERLQSFLIFINAIYLAQPSAFSGAMFSSALNLEDACVLANNSKEMMACAFDGRGVRECGFRLLGERGK
ncbi:hypothetical protein HUU40_08955 [candidate division KSB1 bacterium]|nr:hypothetical protein [candidate division KSB1 bacterium]